MAVVMAVAMAVAMMIMDIPVLLVIVDGKNILEVIQPQLEKDTELEKELSISAKESMVVAM